MTVRQVDELIERDEDSWPVASVPQLPGCHTQAKTQDALIDRIKEAIALYLDERGEPTKHYK